MLFVLNRVYACLVCPMPKPPPTSPSHDADLCLLHYHHRLLLRFRTPLGVLTMEEDAKAAKYACKCLNILITAQETDQQPPTSGRDYVPLYVGEDGIEIVHHMCLICRKVSSYQTVLQVHRQLSLRTRSAATPLNTMSEDRYLQYTTVSCLVCDTETYRILSEVTRDSESKEGPILPTDEWVESEVLHSKSGWIEVCVARSGCIVSLWPNCPSRSLSLFRLCTFWRHLRLSARVLSALFRIYCSSLLTHIVVWQRGRTNQGLTILLAPFLCRSSRTVCHSKRREPYEARDSAGSYFPPAAANISAPSPIYSITPDTSSFGQNGYEAVGFRSQ